MQGHEIELILVALLAMSEALSLIPALKANSVFQLIWDILKKVKAKLPAIKKALIKIKEFIKELRIEKK